MRSLKEALISKDKKDWAKPGIMAKPGVMLKDNDLVLVVVEDDLGEEDITAGYGVFVETSNPEDNYIDLFNYDLKYALLKKTFKYHGDDGYSYYIAKIYRPIDGEAHLKPDYQHKTLLGEPEKDSRYELIYKNKELIKKFKL